MCRTDEQCIRDCLDGHPEDFRHLVVRHQAALMGVLRSSLRDEEQAAEAAQEAFVRAYFGLHNLKKPDSFFSWLVGIANRVVQENRRDEKRRHCVAFDQRQIADPNTSDESASDMALRDAVESLPDVYRQVVLMRHYGGCSCAEVGKKLDVPICTVTKRLSRAYAMLRERLEQKQ